MKIAVNIREADAVHVMAFVDGTALHADRPTSHGQLTLESLAAMLLEDVALAVRRPGSWEGSKMGALLEAHGYTV